MVALGTRARIPDLNDDTIRATFPALAAEDYAETSSATAEYNCIAWAAGDAETWWWPDPFGDYYWPEDVPRVDSLEAFVVAFRRLGYEPCIGAGHEDGWQRVAIYVDALGTPTHAARELTSGEWTSKLGRSEDIRHASLESLSGAVYGTVGLLLRRPAKQG